jgi:hypothetical protein
MLTRLSDGQRVVGNRLRVSINSRANGWSPIPGCWLFLSRLPQGTGYPLFYCVIVGGSDGTRTRGLRRDRPAF